MPKYLTQKEAYLKCKKEGNILFLENIDFEKIKSTMSIIDADLTSATILSQSINKKSTSWNSVYKRYYDALRELTENYLRFHKIKISNHQCLFSYLCEKHPELELSWDFFEKLRTKRNGINYYGQGISYEDFKEVDLQLKIYIKKLKEEIEKSIMTFEKNN